jgi:hypothetical protein
MPLGGNVIYKKASRAIGWPFCAPGGVHCHRIYEYMGSMLPGASDKPRDDHISSKSPRTAIPMTVMMIMR